MLASTGIYFKLVFSFLLVILPHYGSSNTSHHQNEIDDDWNLSTYLPNNRKLPLIGVGVGNLSHDRISQVISHASKEGIHLVDTAHASHNEDTIAGAIQEFFRSEDNGSLRKRNGHKPAVVHVVTKVWYTHLGYNRTKLSVSESLSALKSNDPSIDVRVHMLLHWPRCDDNIQWMNCEAEEEQLPQYVKDSGPPPHLNKENAWRDSWRALEDLYMDEEVGQMLESIGVSNFSMDDMKILLSSSQIAPHIYQGNIWAALHDPYLMRLLQENGIIFQAYNVINGVISQQHSAPHAYASLNAIGIRLRETSPFSPSQVVLAWLIQNNISVIPRASSPQHQLENSPVSIAQVPILSEEQKQQIESLVSALLRGQDIEEKEESVRVTFANLLNHVPIQVFWFREQTREEIEVVQSVHPGESKELHSHPGHVFVVYDVDRSIRKEFKIQANYGGHEHFSVEL